MYCVLIKSISVDTISIDLRAVQVQHAASSEHAHTHTHTRTSMPDGGKRSRARCTNLKNTCSTNTSKCNLCSFLPLRRSGRVSPVRFSSPCRYRCRRRRPSWRFLCTICVLSAHTLAGEPRTGRRLLEGDDGGYKVARSKVETPSWGSTTEELVRARQSRWIEQLNDRYTRLVGRREDRRFSGLGRFERIKKTFL